MTLVRVPISGTIGKAIRINPDATVGAQISANVSLPDGTVPTLAELADALYAASPPKEFINPDDPSSGSAGFVFESDIIDGVLLARVADNERITGMWQFDSLLMTNDASIDWLDVGSVRREFINFSELTGTEAIEQQFGTSLADSNITSPDSIPNVTIKTLLGTGALTTGDIYLLMARCGSRSDKHATDRQGNELEILYDGIKLATARFGKTSGQAGPPTHQGEELSGYSVVTASAAGELAIKGHVYTAPDNSMTINGAAFYALNLTDVGASNFAESMGGGAATPVTTSFVDGGAQLTIPGADGTEDYILLYQMKGETDSRFTQLDIALTGGPWTGDERISTMEAEHNHDAGETAGDQREVFGMMILENPAASTVIKMRVKRTTSSPGPFAKLLSSRMMAIKLSAFAEYATSFTLDQTDPPSSGEQRLETATLVSTQANGTEFAVFGGWHDFYPASGFNSQGEINVDKDGGGDVVAGWDQSIVGEGTDTFRIPRHAWPLVSTTANNGVSLETTLDVIPAPNQAGEEWGSSSVVIVALIKKAETFVVGNTSYPTVIRGASVKIETTLNVTGAVDFDSTLNVNGTSTFAAVTAISYDGILAANLLDKTATETITGVYSFQNAGGIVIFDSGGTDSVTFSHDGTDFNFVAANTTAINFTGVTNYFFDSAVAGKFAVREGSTIKFEVDHNSKIVFIHDGWALKIEDTASLGNVLFVHNGTDFKSVFTSTTDWDITGITLMNIDGGITAASYDGILAANLLDKTAAETITQTWTFAQNSGEKLILKDSNSVGDAVLNFIAFNDMNDLRQGFIGFGSSGNSKLTISNSVGDIVLGAANTDITGALTAASYDGVLAANLLDKTAAETITGAYTFAVITATSYDGILAANLLDKIAAETVSGVYDFTGGLKRSGNHVLEGSSSQRSVFRAPRLRVQPGATPGTNINCTDSFSAHLNDPDLANAVNLAKGGTSGGWSLNANGKNITYEVANAFLMSGGVTIVIHDINSSSTTEMYTVTALIVSGDIVLQIFKRGSSATVDWTTIMDAGDLVDFVISYISNT